MKTIVLSRGFEMHVDDGDFERVSAVSWHPLKSRNTHYAIASAKPLRGMLAHHFIIGNRQRLDHRDGNGLNNQRSTLRLASVSENNWNARKRKDNTVGFKGVHLDHNGQFRARIRVHGKRIQLGQFFSAKQAANAYDEAARTYFGEFVWTNSTEGR